MTVLLSEDFIRQRLAESYQPGVQITDGYAGLFAGRALICAAVLVPLAYVGDAWHLLFTRRTERVDNHKGQVSFPGGACDAGETTPEETALREAEEEIGLHPADVRLLGRMNTLVTITGYQVTPVVGIFPWPYVFRVSGFEVERVFIMPLEYLARRENRWEFFRPGTNLPVVAYHPFDGELLWGATARMVVEFVTLLGLSDS